MRGTGLDRPDDFLVVQVVGGDFELRANDQMDESDVGSLEQVEGAFMLIDNPSLGRSRHNSVTTVGSVLIEGNPLLADIRLGSLGDVTGSYVIDGAEISNGNSDFGGPVVVGGDFRMTHHSQWDDIGMINDLLTVAGTLEISGNPLLPEQDVLDWIASQPVMAGATKVCENENGQVCSDP